MHGTGRAHAEHAAIFFEQLPANVAGLGYNGGGSLGYMVGAVWATMVGQFELQWSGQSGLRWSTDAASGNLSLGSGVVKLACEPAWNSSMHGPHVELDTLILQAL